MRWISQKLNNRGCMKRFTFMCILMFAGVSVANESSVIDDPHVAMQLNAVQSKLDEVSSSVMNCIESGAEHTVCLCENQQIIGVFNKSVNTLFEKNDELKSLDLVRFKSADGVWVTQSLQGILKQASAGKPLCN